MSVVDRLRELEAAATPEPWSPTEDNGSALWDVVAPDDHDYRLSMSITEDDAVLIAAMRNALPALLDIAEALMEAHERLCGCDFPGRMAYCIAGLEFAALARLDDAAGQP